MQRNWWRFELGRLLTSVDAVSLLRTRRVDQDHAPVRSAIRQWNTGCLRCYDGAGTAESSIVPAVCVEYGLLRRRRLELAHDVLPLVDEPVVDKQLPVEADVADDFICGVGDTSSGQWAGRGVVDCADCASGRAPRADPRYAPHTLSHHLRG
jgi:hypothetical protein